MRRRGLRCKGACEGPGPSVVQLMGANCGPAARPGRVGKRWPNASGRPRADLRWMRCAEVAQGSRSPKKKAGEGGGDKGPLWRPCTVPLPRDCVHSSVRTSTLSISLHTQGEASLPQLSGRPGLVAGPAFASQGGVGSTGEPLPVAVTERHHSPPSRHVATAGSSQCRPPSASAPRRAGPPCGAAPALSAWRPRCTARRASPASSRASASSPRT